ncbi:MAG: hypothetical protein ACRDSK_27730 [Actinophytocola sp.]|uniref:hypothetical protein n=1 Tax=Actinophytocola sp. TaxID=1872138 RepID=UPI003D6AF991
MVLFATVAGLVIAATSRRSCRRTRLGGVGAAGVIVAVTVVLVLLAVPDPGVVRGDLARAQRHRVSGVHPARGVGQLRVRWRSATILCPYDAERLSSVVLADAAATHSILVDHDPWWASPDYAPTASSPPTTNLSTPLPPPTRSASRRARRTGFCGGLCG